MPTSRAASRPWTLRAAVLAAAALGLGLSMPSCPGQKALEERVDAVATAQSGTKGEIQKLDETVKALQTELAQHKQAMADLTGALGAQKTALEQLDGALKQMQAARGAPAKGKPGAKAPVKVPPKKRR